jgi:hypothetical protein
LFSAVSIRLESEYNIFTLTSKRKNNGISNKILYFIEVVTIFFIIFVLEYYR